MKIKTSIWFLVSLFWLLAADIAFSGETDPESKPHPILGSRFLLGVGTFWPEKDFEIRVDGTGPGDQLDFEEGFRANNSEDTFSGNFVWRFGQKWTLQAQAWGVETKAGTVLAEDIEWGNFTFREGTFANAGIDLEILRMVLGRKIKSGPNYEFGLGVGLHWMEIDAFLEGEIQVNEGTTEFHRGTVEAEFPGPTWQAGTFTHGPRSGLSLPARIG